MRRRAKRRHGEDCGFTILETMMTLVILGILAALAIPAIQTSMRLHAINSATQEVMHLVDFARVQALSRNRAYRLVVDKAFGPLGQGRIYVDESENTRCNGFGPNGLSSVRVLNFNSKDLMTVKVVEAHPSGFGLTFNLCFKPDGRVLQTDTSRPVKSTDDAYGAGEAIIVLRRVGGSMSGSGPIGVPHQIVIPYNGIPRFKAGSPSAGS